MNDELYGFNQISVDGKGRMLVPKTYSTQLRKEGDGKLVISSSVNQDCLTIFTNTRWEHVQNLMKLNRDNANIDVLRIVFGHRIEVEMDNAGRILIPRSLRASARIDGEVYLIGMGTKFELWNPDIYNKYVRKVRSGKTTQQSGWSVDETLRKLGL